jgi:HEAT repeat protein
VFEAYGQFAGEAALPRLRELLEPRGIFRRKTPPDTRACAIFALAKVRTFDARMLVDRFTADKEPSVRSAANAVLRDWLS